MNTTRAGLDEESLASLTYLHSIGDGGGIEFHQAQDRSPSVRVVSEHNTRVLPPRERRTNRSMHHNGAESSQESSQLWMCRVQVYHEPGPLH